MYMQTIAGLAIFSTLALAFVNLFNRTNSELSNAQTKSIIYSHQTHIKSSLLSSKAWEYMLVKKENKQNFKCFVRPSSKCPGVGGSKGKGKRGGKKKSNMGMSFIPFDAAGRELYPNTKSQKFGLNLNGTSCTSFSSNDKTSNDCPIGVRFTWERICVDPCQFPLARLSVDFSYNANILTFPFNVDKLDFSIIHPGGGKSNVITSNSFGWVDLGTTRMISGSLVRFREHSFSLNLPRPGTLNISIFSRVDIPQAEPRSSLSSISTVEIDGIRCSRNRVSTKFDWILESSTSCFDALDAGSHTIRVTGSGWIDSATVSPTFEGGYVGYQILEQ